MEDFSLNFKVFILITIYLVFCVKDKTFVGTTHRFCKGSYWIKSYESLSFLIHFILFPICITFLLVKILLFMTLKSANFIVSLYCTICKYKMTITFVILTFEHERLHNLLRQWIDLIISRTVKPESTSKIVLFETNSQILLFLYSSSMCF